MPPDRDVADLESFLAGPAGPPRAPGVIVEESPADIREERR
jgi:hypothetical protein